MTKKVRKPGFHLYYWKQKPVSEKRFAYYLRRYCGGRIPTQPLPVEGRPYTYMNHWLVAKGDRVVEEV